jgi:tetratricopeptide (TPR) repeat protein
VNKEQSEKCRDLGALALRQGDYEKAVKMLEKSLQLYPLPGVEALLAHAKTKLNETKHRSSSSSNHNSSSSSRSSNNSRGDTNNDSNASRTSHHSTTANRRSASNASTSSATPDQQQQQTQSNGSDGRAYTQDQVLIVKKVLRAMEGGRGAHYRVLDIPSTATESDIKKAYRKLSLKVHPDKVRTWVSLDYH